MEISKDYLVGVVVDEGEIEELRNICRLYCIKVNERLFEDGAVHYLWALGGDEFGGMARNLGLVGTQVMRNLKTVLHGIEELKDYMDAVIQYERRSASDWIRQFTEKVDELFGYKVRTDYSKAGQTIVSLKRGKN